VTDWQPPSALPDLRHIGVVALDIETCDEGLRADRGPGWPWRGGYIVGVSLAWRAESTIHTIYVPLRHPDSNNFDREQVISWLRDLIASGVKIVTKNGLYDWGWLWADLGVEMPPAACLEEIDALATIVDENRLKYSLDALCAWRGFPGKDDAFLLEGCAALDLIPARVRKTFRPQSVLWQLPARFVGPYAETDAARTLQLFEDLEPILDREGTRRAYRLEVELLPMVHRMRRRGIRIDSSAAEQASDLLLRRRDAVLAQISEKLGSSVGMHEINGRKWLTNTFDQFDIKYPLTKKGNPSFKRGKRGWMQYSSHWLPPLIAAADQLDQYGDYFLQQQILGHIEGGRAYGEIHPHRSDYGGTRSLRFSYSHPPLQQMPKHDEELAPLIRNLFLPEEGEVWASCDFSQQEFRLAVHFAARKKYRGAAAARDRYINDPHTDIHAYTSELTGGKISRQDGKTVNFMTIYGAGPETLSLQLKKPLHETKALLDLYGEKMPFISRLATACKNAAHRDGFFALFNGARRHFNLWAPGGALQEGAGPCARDEAVRRTQDPNHPWYRRKLWRADTYKALNALIQSAAAVQTKEWMRAAFREGVVPLLQMHDSLELSVASPDIAEMVARLGEEVIKLEVPMKVDLAYGRTWGDAKHTWAGLHGETGPQVELAEELPDTPAPTACESPKFSNDFDEALMAASMDNTEAPPSPPPPPPNSPPPPPPEDKKPAGGNGHGDFSGFDGSKSEAEHDTYAKEHAGEPFNDGYLRRKGYKLAHVFDYALPDGTLLYQQNRYELKSGIAPSKDRPRKRFLPHRSVNGKDTLGAGDRLVIYNWPAIMRASSGSYIFIAEGETKARILIDNGLLATTVLSHKWTPECVAALTGHHLYILADHDKDGERLAKDAQKKLAPVAASTRIVPAAHLWKHLPGSKDTELHDDVKDWIEHGGDPAKLLEICQEIPADGAAILESVCAADVEIEDFDWIWPDRFALRKIGLVVGLPDEGKGQLLSYIIARITRAAEWPCGEGYAPLGNAILLSAEDDTKDTITPRLIAAGADLKRVTIINMVQEATGTERMFSLISDLAALRQKIVDVGNVKVVVIDPVSAYLGIGQADSFRATDVRAILGPLKVLAEELEVAVIGIMHFNKKTDVTNLLLRVSDSLAYSAASRHVYGVVDDPDNRRKLFVRGKNNIAKTAQKTLAYSFDDCEVGISKKTGRVVRAPYIVWEPDPIDITATEALSAAAENKSPSARDNAKHFLKALLGNGPVESKEVQDAAKENGISAATLRRAAKDLHVEIKHDGPPNDKGDRSWRWHLPKLENEDDDK
jgi:DNA polymerase I-like protein with 3'-5' exonuclease and polymerase domains